MSEKKSTTLFSRRKERSKIENPLFVHEERRNNCPAKEGRLLPLVCRREKGGIMKKAALYRRDAGSRRERGKGSDFFRPKGGIGLVPVAFSFKKKEEEGIREGEACAEAGRTTLS